MRRVALLAFMMLAACESPVSEMVAGPKDASSSLPQVDEPFMDWVPAPPFGTHISKYEFFPDTLASTFDSISTAYDTVTWRNREYPRVTAYGNGWTVPVWTDAILSTSPELTRAMLAPRVERYMTKIGRLGAGILNQTPEYGIALLDRIPGASSLLGATYYSHNDSTGLVPLMVVLVYDLSEGLLPTDHSATGIMLHEFGHVIADPILKCSEKWRDALIDDHELFPSLYSRYLVKDHDPRIGTSQERNIDYWDCEKHPTANAARGDTIQSGEDIAESFSAWWLVRCKAGDEPTLDNLVTAWFPHRLTTLDRALDPRARQPFYTPACQFPITEDESAAANRFMQPPKGRDTIPDGIIAHGPGPALRLR